MKTRIGCCLPGGSFMPQGEAEVAASPLEVIQAGYRAVLDAGYDYAECTVGMLMQLSESELAQATQLYEQGLLKIEVCNSFIPGSLPIFCAEKDAEREAYMREVFRRMKLLGADTVVFGSGKARTAPENCTPAQIVRTLDAFLSQAAKLAEPMGITVVIEPLNRSETNCICSVSEGTEYVRRLNLPNLRLLADAYHMFREQEPLTVLVQNDDLLTHIHVAEPPERVYPGRDGGAYLRTFAAVLRGTKYQGRITVECGFRNFVPEIRAALPFLKEIF